MEPTVYTPLLDLSAVDFGAIQGEFLNVVAIALPVVIGMIAIKKGVGALKGLIRKA